MGIEGAQAPQCHHPPGNKALMRPYSGMVVVNNPGLISWRGGIGGLALDSHECITKLIQSYFCWKVSKSSWDPHRRNCFCFFLYTFRISWTQDGLQYFTTSSSFRNSKAISSGGIYKSPHPILFQKVGSCDRSHPTLGGEQRPGDLQCPSVLQVQHSMATHWRVVGWRGAKKTSWGFRRKKWKSDAG